ncbi:MAG: hypothetical protein ACRD4R_06780 [Candidatus Acidiferrales bacterium]
MTITVRSAGTIEQVEIIRKISQGLHTTHNRDGRFQKMWAIAPDGRIFTTRSRGGHYRPARASEIPPPALSA